ncbi:MAG: sensor histidine kinase [Magnetospiraceae bacterium]
MKRVLFLLALGVCFGAFLLWQTAEVTRRIALEQISERSRNTLALVVVALRGDLEKYRYLPEVIAQDPTVRDVLSQAAPDAALLETVNGKLARLNHSARTLDIYLMRPDGETIAASNWQADGTFIGQNFSYRPYFTEALTTGKGRFFAVGTTSGERGYYFAQIVTGSRGAVGVVVVKMQVGHNESTWRSNETNILVADSDGVVFLATQPEWRFKALDPLPDAALQKIRETRRYAGLSLDPLNLQKVPDAPDALHLVTLTREGAANQLEKHQYLVESEQMPGAGWRIMLLADTAPVTAQVQLALFVATIALISLLLAALAIWQRRRHIAERIATQTKANEVLEQRVAERTTALSRANLGLQREIKVREKAEDELRKTQAAVVQTAKLAALGKMSAGLSHELNQPLAAIRSYADNARAFIARGRQETATQNLQGISDLTERMSRIIRNLRTYARGETIELRPTDLGQALEESLVLLNQRIVSENVVVKRQDLDPAISVIGGDVRLQQIFVNLLSNALDAMAESDRREIHIDLNLDHPESVCIQIRDTGPGVDEANIQNIFDPFYSTKEVGRGMGLGLSITYGIVEQFGGAISAQNHKDGGAIFTVTLKRAGKTEEAVA